MRHIWPSDDGASVDQQLLEQLYAYPSDATWLAVNFVSSADGAIEMEGRSAGLSNPADKRVYWLGSALADVVLVGASTATVEEFRGVRPTERLLEQRRRHGLADVPPVAVVTSGRSLSPEAPVITEVATPTIVITSASATPETRAAFTAAGAQVLIAGAGDTVDLPAAIAALVEQGMSRIDCEGGPRLLGSLLAADLVDELRLTISPLLVSGPAERIATGVGIEPKALGLASVLADADTLLLRYLVQR